MKPLLDLAALDVIEILPEERTGHLQQIRWPCPGCAQRRRLSGARTVRVRDRNRSLTYERTILLCASCLTEVGDERLLGAPGEASTRFTGSRAGRHLHT